MAYNKILLKGDIGEGYNEKRAGGTIVPGHIIQQGSSDTVVVHATSSGKWGRYVAIEDALAGPDGVNTKGNTIDDAYTSGDLVRMKQMNVGDEFYGLLAAGAAAVVIGDFLVSNGNGCLIKSAATENDREIVGVAQEAIDNSGGGTAVRIIVEVV